MSAIFGWMGGVPDGGDARDRLARMAGTGAASMRWLAAAEGALAAAGQGDLCDVPAALGVTCRRPRLASGGDARGPGVWAHLLDRGAPGLADLRGPFALALLDRRRGRILLAVDRCGICPLYYGLREGRLVFGSTATAVAGHHSGDPEIETQSIYNYLFCHMVPSPRAIFRGVQRLQPGEYVEVENGRARHGWYLAFAGEDGGRPDPDALAEEFRELLRRAVARAAEDGEAAGSFLSGGTDSSTVAGMLRADRGAPVPTFSIGFDAEGYDETSYARTSASHFGTDHHEYRVTPRDVVDAIPLVASCYDEPFGNASAIPTYYCARLAAESGVSVMLAGDGGDELFGGNARYATQKLFELYGRLPGVVRAGVLDPLATRIGPGAGSPLLRKVHGYVTQARIPMPDRMESYNFLHRTPPEEVFEPGLLDQVDPEEPLRLMREAYDRVDSPSFLQRLLYLDLKNTLADNDLRKVSRMCEAAGVEARYPLLDEEVLDFAIRLPAHLKVRGLKLRYFFKRALADFLPQAVIEKQKHGFGLPFGVWLKDYAPLRELADDRLHGLTERGIVRRDYVQGLLQRHRRDHAGYYGAMIWVLVMLEQWLRAHPGATRPRA